MLEGALTGEHHRDLRIGLVAGLDRFKITDRATGLKNGGNPLADADIGGVAEGEKGIGDHHREIGRASWWERV